MPSTTCGFAPVTTDRSSTAFNGRFADLSPSWKTVLGWDLEEPTERPFVDVIHPHDLQRTLERLFWRLPGIYTTAVGYAGGLTPNPTYEETCSGRTGHAEVVLAVFHPEQTGYDELLRVFWEGHDPTQGMRQGNDVGTQYRSAIYWMSEAQRDAALASRDRFQEALARAGHGRITTEVAEAGPFYYAEDYHQQYLHRHPNGYCGLGGTGVSCPVGVTTA